jgi:hypothetical protein
MIRKFLAALRWKFGANARASQRRAEAIARAAALREHGYHAEWRQGSKVRHIDLGGSIELRRAQPPQLHCSDADRRDR